MNMPSKNKKRTFITKTLLVLLGACLVGAGSFLLYSSLATKKAAVQAPSSVAKASVEKKTPQQKAAYTVPASHPRKLIIKKLGIDAIVIPVGAPDGTMAAPTSAWDTGWYNQSTLPGAGHGALLIDGHVNDALNSPGIFYHLGSLASGDTIELERGDGQKFTYTVAKVDNVPLKDVDMSKMLRSVQEGKEGLNLITCGGFYDEQKKTYDHRVLVFAVRA
jgi:LPXTG-site transpeptidase (sortase) family protein